MKIASILPYKENYTKEGAGAVALWVKEFLVYSKYKKTTTVYGFTLNKNYLSNHYKNIKISTINSKIYSTTKEYSKKLQSVVKEEMILLKYIIDQLWLINLPTLSLK